MVYVPWAWPRIMDSKYIFSSSPWHFRPLEHQGSTHRTRNIWFMLFLETQLYYQRQTLTQVLLSRTSWFVWDKPTMDCQWACKLFFEQDIAWMRRNKEKIWMFGHCFFLHLCTQKLYPPGNTMLVTSRNVLFLFHNNHLLTTRTDDLTLWLSPKCQWHYHGGYLVDSGFF